MPYKELDYNLESNILFIYLFIIYFFFVFYERSAVKDYFSTFVCYLCTGCFIVNGIVQLDPHY